MTFESRGAEVCATEFAVEGLPPGAYAFAVEDGRAQLARVPAQAETLMRLAVPPGRASARIRVSRRGRR